MIAVNHVEQCKLKCCHCRSRPDISKPALEILPAELWIIILGTIIEQPRDLPQFIRLAGVCKLFQKIISDHLFIQTIRKKLIPAHQISIYNRRSCKYCVNNQLIPLKKNSQLNHIWGPGVWVAMQDMSKTFIYDCKGNPWRCIHEFLRFWVLFHDD